MRLALGILELLQESFRVLFFDGENDRMLNYRSLQIRSFCLGPLLSHCCHFLVVQIAVSLFRSAEY